MEYSQSIEIDAGDRVWALTFTVDGEYFVSGGKEGVQVWRVRDGEQIATMQVGSVWSVTASKDGRFIAAGSDLGEVWVWDTTNYAQVFVDKISGEATIYDVDFSPNSSTRLVSADGENNTVTVWDTVLKNVHTLDHGPWAEAAKYSPQGDRIATATEKSVRVWDSNDGCLLVEVKVGLKLWHCLFWSSNHLFVTTKDSKIKKINAFTGSTVSEWSVPDDDYSWIALPQHGQFIAYSTRDNVTLWGVSTHAQLGLISRSRASRAVAFSPDDRFAIVTQDQKVIVNDLPFIGVRPRTNKYLPSYLHLIHKEPDIRIEGGPLHAWKNGQLKKAEALLTAIPWSEHTAHHVLASRALVRACLRQWDAALVDAEESIKAQPSTFGYIAKFVAVVGSKGTHAGCRVWDVASLHFRSDHLTILLLIKATVLFIAGEHRDAMSRIDDLIAARPLEPMFYVVQAYMLLLHGDSQMKNGKYDHAIQSFKDARGKLGDRKERPPLIISLISGWKFDDLAIIIQQRLCEAFFVAGHTKDVGESVLHMMGGKASMSETIKIWISDFMERCLSAPENDLHTDPATSGRNNVPHFLTPVLREWAKLTLTSSSWKDALASATHFTLPRFTIYQVLCEHLEITGHLADSVACFHQMCEGVAQEMVAEQVNWMAEFSYRCLWKVANLGDISMNAGEYDEAIWQYTAALSLNPPTLQDLLGKRSKAHICRGAWEEALNDANQIIKLDPSSALGYERKHAALHGMGRYDDATETFEVMLLKMAGSGNTEIRERSCHYIKPQKTKEKIRTTIKDTIRDSPPILINTISGRLCDKAEQAAAFESTIAFMKLLSSAKTYTDEASITEEVREFYRYATFSHKWEENEPLFEKVIRIVVYDLEGSPTHEKLQMFCRIVREAGFNWAWSDTCCINKGDHFVLQEALVSMFNWYERSAMTIIFLRGVGRRALRGALTRSVWNMRAWTLQEYHASKVVRIYTEDWTPYLGLEIYNHEESPEIISEMEEATGISAQALMELRPGLDNIREKLRLASTRQTTRVEDAAYSLLGIFSTSLPITYGEGDKALGRLLAQLLTTSGDISILAWVGKSGSFNSCLPTSITAFSQHPTPHIPPAMPDAEMQTTIAGLRSLSATTVTSLFERVNELLVPSFSGRRMRLPCITFKLGQVSVSRNGSERVFRAQTNSLGVVEIRTEEDLSQLASLFLIHPWIDFLLDRHPVGNVTNPVVEDNLDEVVLGELPSPSNLSDSTSLAPQTRAARFIARLGRPFGGRAATSAVDTNSLLPPSTLSPSEKQARVLQFVARLRQPFGALLLTPTRRNVEEYRRVASESLITVQVKELTPEILEKLINNVRMLDVL